MEKNEAGERMSEIEYYPFFAAFLEKQRYETFLSDIDFNLPEPGGAFVEGTDAGVKRFKTAPPRLATIEVKRSDVSKVIQQALLRRQFATYSYIGFFFDATPELGYIIYRLSKDFYDLQRLGLGVLLYDQARDHMFTVKTAKASKQINPAYRDLLLAACPPK